MISREYSDFSDGGSYSRNVAPIMRQPLVNENASAPAATPVRPPFIITPIQVSSPPFNSGNDLAIPVSRAPVQMNSAPVSGNSGPGPNPSWTRNAEGQYNFNGDSGDPSKATNFGSLFDEEALWVSKYGQPSPGVTTQSGGASLSNPAPVAVVAPLPSPASIAVASPPPPSSVQVAVAQAVAPTPPTLGASSAPSSVNGTNPAPSDPYQRLLDNLSNTGTNAYGPGGSDQSGTGPPHSTSGLQAIQPQAINGHPAASSGGKSPIVIILFLLAAGFGVWYYMKHHHKKVGTVNE